MERCYPIVESHDKQEELKEWMNNNDKQQILKEIKKNEDILLRSILDCKKERRFVSHQEGFILHTDWFQAVQILGCDQLPGSWCIPGQIPQGLSNPRSQIILSL